MRGYNDVASLLLVCGADVDQVAVYKKRTPLHLACRGGHKDVVTLLLDCGVAQVNIRDEDGKTPLDVARDGGHTDIASLISRQNMFRVE